VKINCCNGILCNKIKIYTLTTNKNRGILTGEFEAAVNGRADEHHGGRARGQHHGPGRAQMIRLRTPEDCTDSCTTEG
jgi:hypothetical protein